jgi:hypothetical protein
MQSELGASWSPVAHLQPKEHDLQLGLCRFFFLKLRGPVFAIIMFLLQLCFHDLHNRLLSNTDQRAHRPRIRFHCRSYPSRESPCSMISVLVALTSEQALFPCLVLWLARDSKISSLRVSPFHWPCAALAAASAILLPRESQCAKVIKRE